MKIMNIIILLLPNILGNLKLSNNQYYFNISYNGWNHPLIFTFFIAN